MSDSSDLEKLLRLKRYETPGEEYFQQFTRDFKERQRSEMLQQSSVSLLSERVTQFVSEMGPAKWAFPVGAAAAAIAGGFYFFNPANAVTTEQQIAQEMKLAPEQDSLEGTPTINLDLPRTRIPGLQDNSGGQMIPVGIQGPYREF